MSLKGKRILIGVTGGIAAYKIPFLIRSLKKLEAEVRVMMTPASSHFVSPLTLSTLSENEVAIKMYDELSGKWTNHVEWGLWPDLIILAPLTAQSLAKIAHGISDNFLLTSYLSSNCKVAFAPAMDLDMYAHPTTKLNISKLKEFGHLLIPAEKGALASGLIGEGRMAEPETIVQYVEQIFSNDSRFTNKTVLITAGPTYEAIDPVRFIGNHASGKMGYELAVAAANKGAKVKLILGPSSLKISHPNIELIPVFSAENMLDAAKNNWSTCDLGIFAAAVADYRPKAPKDQKIKKNDDEMSIDLVKNPDVLAWCSENRTNNQKVTGFALETQNGTEYAKGKLKRKNLDAIAMNQLGEKGVGFGVDTNSLELFFNDNKSRIFELQSKKELAYNLLNALAEQWYE